MDMNNGANWQEFFDDMNRARQAQAGNQDPAAANARGPEGARNNSQNTSNEPDYWTSFGPWAYHPFYATDLPHRGRRGGPGFPGQYMPANPPPPPMTGMGSPPPAPPASGAPPPPAGPPGSWIIPGAHPPSPLDRPSSLASPSQAPEEPHSRPPTPPTPPERAPEEPGHGRSPSPSPHGGPGHHGRHHGHHGHQHGPCRGGGRGRGGRHGGPDHREWAENMRTTIRDRMNARMAHHQARQQRHREGAEWSRHRGPDGPVGAGGPFGPNGAPPGFNMEGLSDYVAQFSEQLPNMITNLFNSGNLGPSDPSAPRPAVDVFNTDEAYVIHAYVPGAKKADLNVSFDSTTYSIKISGVQQRPDEVNEAMLETMVQTESKVGYWEKVVFLERDGKFELDEPIAKLEDGVLRVEVPKVLAEGWTDVKKVVIE